MEILVVVVVMLVAVAVIGGPLRRQPGGSGAAASSPERAELEAAKEAKLREIRDTELDHRLGKLSEDDWRSQDAALRRQAIEILHRIDELGTDRERGEEGSAQTQG